MNTMDTLEERELKPILLEERTEDVTRCNREAEYLCTLLDNINEVFSITSPDQVPANVDDFIFAEALNKDPFLANMHKRKPVTLAEVTLPNEMIALREYLIQYNRMNKEVLGCIYKKKSENRFLIDPVLLENILNKYRVYASTPEQIKRYHQGQTILEATLETLKNHNVNFDSIGFLVWKDYRSPMLLRERPAVDHHWIMSGRIRPTNAPEQKLI